jgi:hypothetical protein
MPIRRIESFSGNTIGGFADYNDTSTSSSPLSLVADVWTSIPNDGLGLFSNSGSLPQGVSSLMNTASGELDFTQLPIGYQVYIRNDFTITPTSNNCSLGLRYMLGTGAGSYTLETSLGRLDRGSGIQYRFSLKPDLIYIGDSNTKDNPIALQVRLSVDGSLVNAGTALGVIAL